MGENDQRLASAAEAQTSPRAHSSEGQSESPQQVTLAGRLRACCRLPLALNWGGGLLLAACFWMPQVVGCDGSVQHPNRLASVYVANDGYFEAAQVVLPHFFGAVCAFLLAAAVCLCSDRIPHFLAVGSFVVWFPVTLGLLIPSVVMWTQLEGWLLAVAYHIFPFGIPWVAFGLALRKRDWMTAWARLTSLLTLLIILCLFFTYIFYEKLLYGLILSYAGCGMLVVAPWWLWGNWERLLVDRSRPKRRLQFRIWHFFAWTGAAAALFGYYRVLSWLSG